MKKYSYEELVQLKQEVKINWVDFVKAGDSREEYELWCREHGVEENEDNAQLYLEMTENGIYDNQ